LDAFAEKQMFARLTPDVSHSKAIFKFSLILLGFTFLVIAIANPQIGSKMVKGERAGADIAIALDISNSMLAEDIQPNRLTRAKKTISNLISKLNNDRIAIIIFAGKSYTQLPLTSDYGAAKLFLESINTDMIEAQGTAIGDAIEKSMQTFGYGDEDRPWQKNKSRTIIIISDGENHEDDAIAMATKARSEGIVVNTIGMGLPTGVPIPQYNRGVHVGYKKDRDGNPITTKLNENMLAEIAQAGGGVYLRAGNINANLDEIVKEIEKLDKQNFGETMFSEYESKYQYPLALAIIFLALELFIFERRNKIINTATIFGRKESNDKK
jgi:Ca-activated chloride channel family protein